MVQCGDVAGIDITELAGLDQVHEYRK
jgi:hypothetical protein